MHKDMLPIHLNAKQVAFTSKLQPHDYLRLSNADMEYIFLFKILLPFP